MLKGLGGAGWLCEREVMKALKLFFPAPSSSKPQLRISSDSAPFTLLQEDFSNPPAQAQHPPHLKGAPQLAVARGCPREVASTRNLYIPAFDSHGTTGDVTSPLRCNQINRAANLSIEKGFLFKNKTQHSWGPHFGRCRKGHS